MVLQSKSDGSYELVELPAYAQTAPILSGLSLDIQGDDKPEFIAVGSIYNTEVETPRMDMGTGLVLMPAAEGLEAVQPLTAGSFFGQLVVVAEAIQDGSPGHAIADGTQVCWYPQGNPAAPIDSQLAYAIWRGHQLLNSFNEAE